jgi:hypothetical protein
MALENGVSVLVADSGAFIKNSALEKWSPYVVTVGEVVSEVRDECTRRRLQVLPYELHIKEPSQEALQHGEWEVPDVHIVEVTQSGYLIMWAKMGLARHTLSYGRGSGTLQFSLIP